MSDYIFDKFDVYPSYIESERLKFIPLHQSKITVKTLYDKFRNVSSDTTKYVTFIKPYTQIIEAKEYMQKCKNEFENGESVTYSIIEKDTEDFIGLTSLKINWDRNIIVSGIYLFKNYWNNGYSTERGELFIDIAFKEYDIDFWVSRCSVDNESSINSMEKYIIGNGGEKWGTLPNRKFTNELKNVYVYAISRKQYFK